MTHYSAETLELVSDDELSERYDHYLDNVELPGGITIDGNDLIPSEVLKSADPIAYEQSLNTYINALYDAGELTSEWDRDDLIKELCHDWAFNVLGEVMNDTTTEEDETIYTTLYRLYERSVLELDSGEIQLSSQYSMSEVLIAIGTALNEKKIK